MTYKRAYPYQERGTVIIQHRAHSFFNIVKEDGKKSEITPNYKTRNFSENQIDALKKAYAYEMMHAQVAVNTYCDTDMLAGIFIGDGTFTYTCHPNAGPAIRTWHPNGQLALEEYLFANKHTRPAASGPAISKWDENGGRIKREYWLQGEQVKMPADGLGRIFI